MLTDAAMLNWTHLTGRTSHESLASVPGFSSQVLLERLREFEKSLFSEGGTEPGAIQMTDVAFWLKNGGTEISGPDKPTPAKWR